MYLPGDIVKFIDKFYPPEEDEPIEVSKSSHEPYKFNDNDTTTTSDFFSEPEGLI